MSHSEINMPWWCNTPIITDGEAAEIESVPFTDVECECICRLFDTELGLTPLPAYDAKSVSRTCRSWYLPLIEELLACRGVDGATELTNALYARFKMSATGTYEKDLRMNGTERGGKLGEERFAYWYDSDPNRLLYDIKALQIFCGKTDAWRMRERRAERGQWREWAPTKTTLIPYKISQALYKVPFEPSWHMRMRNGEKRLPPSIWMSMLSIYTNPGRSDGGLPDRIRRAESKYPGITALAEKAIRDGKEELERRNLETSSETYEQDMAFDSWLKRNPQAADIATATRNALMGGGEFIGFGMQFATSALKTDDD